jgi:hypothetical protein
LNPAQRAFILNLFNFPLLKAKFERKEATKDSLIAGLVEDVELQELAIFVARNMSTLRTNIYVFAEAKNKGESPVHLSTDGLDELAILSHQGEGGERTFILPVRLRVYSSPSPILEEDIVLPWPVQVVRIGKAVCLVLAIMRPSSRALVPSGRVFFKSKRGLEDRDVVSVFERDNSTAISRWQGLEDGVNTLWDADVLDGCDVRYLETHSSRQESMHKDRLLKVTYPDRYGEIRGKPLQKSVFRVLDPNSSIDRFAVDPALGVITFNRGSDPGESYAIVKKVVQAC